MMLTQHLECTECGWTGHEDDLRSECVFAGNREEPAEYDAHCIECGNHVDSMIDITAEEHERRAA